MRTITKTLHERLIAQAEEADIQGFDKLASHLTNQIEKTAKHVRKDNDFYVYSSDELEKDVESHIWEAVLRVADYHNTNFDSLEVQRIIEKTASSLLEELRTQANISHGVGPFEPNVPGECKENVVISLEDENE